MMPTIPLIRPQSRRSRRKRGGAALALALALAVPAALVAQAGQARGGGGAAPASAKTVAPVDLTGYWVSIVTEDWIERMAPDSPPSGTGRGGRGVFPGGGGQPTATRPANADPCRVYAAGGSLRVPGRLNITWADDNTLKLDMDAGRQTRLLHFGATQPPSSERSAQGYSVATWETGRAGGAFGGGRGGGAPAPPRWANLKVVTTSMNGGYLLSSRSTYSENAVLTEHFSAHQDFGADYFTVTAIIEDGPTTRITSSTFKKEPNGSKFSPTGCDIVR